MRKPHNAAWRAPLGTAAVLLSASAWAQGGGAAPAPAADPYPTVINYVLLGTAIFQVVVILSLAGIMRTLSAPGGPWKGLIKRAGVVLLLFTLANEASAAGGAATFTNKGIFWWLIVVNLFLFFLILVQVVVLRFLMKTVFQLPEKTFAAEAEQESKLAIFWRKLTDRVPTEREADVMLDHNYDGIHELDNVLPPWWLWLFYGTVVYAVVYLVNVHVIRVWPSQAEEFNQEMAVANADVAAYKATMKGLVDENSVTLLTEPDGLAAGERIYTQNCTPCHGGALEGKEGLGPNLADAYWIHGGGIKNVFKTITYGVPAKGMIAWKAQMKPAEIQQVASYVLSRQGSAPPNGKAPEGQLWVEEGTAPSDSTAAPVDSTTLKADTTKLAAGMP